jgi:hypothetical protein
MTSPNSPDTKADPVVVSAPATGGGDDTRVTPDDIESKFRELSADVDDFGAEVRSMAVTVGAVVVVGVVAVAFWFGRRRGRNKATIVEIRRS